MCKNSWDLNTLSPVFISIITHFTASNIFYLFIYLLLLLLLFYGWGMKVWALQWTTRNARNSDLQSKARFTTGIHRKMGGVQHSQGRSHAVERLVRASLFMASKFKTQWTFHGDHEHEARWTWKTQFNQSKTEKKGKKNDPIFKFSAVASF